MTFAPSHILVPVEVGADADSLLTEHLVDAAADVARAWSARVTLMHALPPMAGALPLGPEFTGGAYQMLVTAVETQRKEAQRGLDVLVERVRQKGLQAEGHLVTDTGSIPELISRAASDFRADLVVLTTHGRHGVRRLLLGSVAERVAHISPAPVLLLKPPRR